MVVLLLEVFNGSMAEAPWTSGLEEGLRKVPPRVAELRLPV